MDIPLTISIGSLKLRIMSPRLPVELLKEYESYIGFTVGNYLCDAVFSDGEHATDGMVKVQQQGTRSLVHREDFDAVVNIPGQYCRAAIDARRLTFNSFLRVLFSMIMPVYQGFLMHASGILVDGKAYVFAGLSGAGKSTVIKNNPSSPSLGDEIIAIIFKDGTWHACSTPFGGELPAVGTKVIAPLAALYLLNKSDKEEITEPQSAEAFEQFLHCIINFSKASDSVSMICRFLSQVMDSVPVRTYHAQIDSSFLSVYNRYRSTPIAEIITATVGSGSAV